MLYREIIAVCYEIHTKHINTLCGQNVELLNVKLAVHIMTTGLQPNSQFIASDTHAHSDKPHLSAKYRTLLHNIFCRSVAFSLVQQATHSVSRTLTHTLKSPTHALTHKLRFTHTHPHTQITYTCTHPHIHPQTQIHAHSHTLTHCNLALHSLVPQYI
jgi:hypothetical protein